MPRNPSLSIGGIEGPDFFVFVGHSKDMFPVMQVIKDMIKPENIVKIVRGLSGKAGQFLTVCLLFFGS